MARINNITKAIEQEYVQMTYEEIANLNIVGLFQRLNMIKVKFNSNHSMLSKMAEAQGLKPNKKISLTNESDKTILFNAYELLQEIRFRITGEPLVYRLYITGEKVAEYVEIGAADLETFIGKHKNSLDISVGQIKKALLESNREDKIKRGTVPQYELAMSYMHKPSNMKSNFYIPVDENFRTFRINKQGENMLVTYNRGHIIEAVDKIIMQQQTSEDSNITFSKELFYKYLKGDNVSGFKGGDTFFLDEEGSSIQVQIKANSARLMRYSSIINALNRVIDIGESIQQLANGGGEKDQVRQQIRKMFSDDSGKIEQISDKIIDNFIDKFLNESFKL